ncbi:MAG: ABC transporter ATP-binding protein [Granulosicoccus sp.]
MVDLKEEIIQLSDVEFGWPGSQQPVLSIPEFSIERGERVFLRGPSGSGKTTLLSIVAAVIAPQSGRVVVDGTALDTLRGGQRDQFRVDRIGLVFQQFNLLPFLSVGENIKLPCRFSKIRRSQAVRNGLDLSDEVDRLLEAMQLSPNAVNDRPVNSLSVGQQQRVAVARALIGRPPLIIADEPTSALDSDTRQAFLDLLFAEVQSAGCTLLFVSHDMALADVFDRCVDLRELNNAVHAQPSHGALQ